MSGTNLYVVSEPKMTTTMVIRDENGYLDKRPPIETVSDLLEQALTAENGWWLETFDDELTIYR